MNMYESLLIVRYTECRISVSYTHLDVYKRQGLMYLGSTSSIRIDLILIAFPLF